MIRTVLQVIGAVVIGVLCFAIGKWWERRLSISHLSSYYRKFAENQMRECDQAKEAKIRENELEIQLKFNEFEKEYQEKIFRIRTELNEKVAAYQAWVAAEDNNRQKYLTESKKRCDEMVGSYEREAQVRVDACKARCDYIVQDVERGMGRKMAHLRKQQKRMIKDVKMAQEAMLLSVSQDTAEKVEQLRAEVERYQGVLERLSALELAAQQERRSNEDERERHRIVLSERGLAEVEELYKVCGSFRISNTVPLYKAIYELYFAGPLKNMVTGLDVGGVCGIYEIVNCVNGKKYVGQSVDVGERWKQHVKRGCGAEVGTIAGAGLYDAMMSDGVWSFEFRLLEECEKAQLNERERWWITHLHTNEVGYNKRV